MNKYSVRIKKLDENAIIPTYGSEFAAGADLYACTGEAVTINPHETKLIHTGIAMEIPTGYAGLVYARSGIASKRGLAPANKVGVIDSDYRGEYIIAMLKRADRIKIGCMAQLVNVLGVFMTDGDGRVLKQTTYYPYAEACRYGHGVAVTPEVLCDTFDAGNRNSEITGVEILSAVATKKDGHMAIFAVNRSEHDDVDCQIQTGAVKYTTVSAKTLYHDDIKAENTFAAPETVVYREEKADLRDGVVSVRLKKHSFSVILLSE